MNIVLTGYETVGDHTEYMIQVSCQGMVWIVSRRFSDFDQLHLRLFQQPGATGQNFPELPVKQWFGRFAPDFLATRQSQLQKYLVQVLSIPGLADHRVLKSFLEVEGHIEHHQTPTPGLNHEEDQSAFHPNLDEPMYTLDLPTSKMNQIVEQTVTRLIDVSSAFDGPGYAHEIPGSEHANQRKMEILQSLPHHVYQTPLNWPKIPSQKIRETNVELEDHAFVRTLMRELSSTLEGHGFTIQEPSQSLIAAL